MNRIVYFLLVFIALGVSACSKKSKSASADSSTAAQGSLLTVSGVKLQGGDAGSALVIDSDREPKYNVFKLTEPDRIVIDLIDARLAEGVPTSLPGENGVGEIRIQSLEDSLSALVRVEVILNSGMNYLASVEGNQLQVKLLSGSITDVPMSSAPASEPPAGDAPVAIAPIPVPEAVPAPEMTPAPELPPEPAPLPQVAEAPKVEEIPPPPVPVPEASTLPEVAPVEPPAPAPEAAAEVAPIPVPIPMAEERSKPVLPEVRDISKAPKKLQSQDIPTSGLTEGTSLLSEIDTKVYTGKRVSLEFQNADVQDVIRLIAEVSKLNVIVADDVKGNLTLKLVDVPWDQALDIILTTLGLDKAQHGNILRVAPAERLKKERETALANDKAAKQLEPLKLKLLNVNYAKADEMSARIKNLLSERGTVDTDSRTNTLIVKDIKEHLGRIENLIRVLDTQTPQVRIESRIVQANDSFSRNIGIQWGPSLLQDADHNTGQQFPYTIGWVGNNGSTEASGGWAVDAGTGSSGSSMGFRLGNVSGIFNLDLRLSYAEVEGLARIVSRPSISVLDNKTARIIQGTKIPFLSSSSDGSNVSFQEAGIEISVTPQITNDGSVILKVTTRSNEAGDAGVGGNPSILIREANTEMLVKSGRTAVMGGVYKTNDVKSTVGVPYLKDIPILGWLFKGHSRSQNREELLIFITPYILSDIRAAQTAPASDTNLETN